MSRRLGLHSPNWSASLRARGILPFKRQAEVTGNICAAAFTHDTSRALDPQLHTHFVIANATRDRAGKWYALNEYEMVRAVRYVGKVYQNEMAGAVQKLGFSSGAAHYAATIRA